MTGNVWMWIGGVSLVWVAAGYYFLFARGNRKMGLAIVSAAPKDDSEVIVSNTKIMINVLFAEDEKKEATPALLADFVISFKDIVSGTYKVPNVVSGATEPVTVQSLTGAAAPGKKQEQEKETDREGLPGDEIPDLSDEPELPELDTENVPEREPDSKVILDESQLVDSNTLILNMLNLN